MSNSSKQTVVVTGASKGLGRFMSLQLLDMGFQVLGCSRSKASIAHKHFEDIACDVANSEDRFALIAHLRKGQYQLYGLVNNAAMGALNQFLTTPTEKVNEVMQANYIANFELSREVAKLMMTTGGRIVNIGSQTLTLNTPLEAAYAASKAAVESLTKISAKELAPLHITVNMVSPGVMHTDIIKGIASDRIDYMLEQQVLPEPLQFADVWAAVKLLLSNEAHRITGQNINIGVV